MKRQCGSCTKCCEGYLIGSAKGKSFYGGKPCHFVSKTKGCTIYKERPFDPCVIYKCAWLIDETLPEWFKPNEINTIIDIREIENMTYINVIEAGETLRADVLSWLIMYALNNQLNMRWTIEGGAHWIGSTEFSKAMENNGNKK